MKHRTWLCGVLWLAAAAMWAQAPPAPSERNVISLREYLESRVQCEKDLVAEQRKTAQLALELQEAVNARHFELLNHENARVKEAQNQFASKDSFDGFAKETTRRLEEITLRLAESDASNAAGRRFLALGMGLLALLITVLTFLRRPRSSPAPSPPAESIEPGHDYRRERPVRKGGR